MINPNEILLESFQHHGRPEAKIEGEWVVMPGYPPARAFTYIHNERESMVNLQLDVEIALDDGRVIGESAAGLGGDRSAAVENAFTKFAASAFHVLLCAFYDYPVDDQIDLSEWEINGQRWGVYSGPYVGMHLSLDGSTDGQGIQPPPPENYRDFIQNEIKSRMLNQDTHWVRFFYAHQNGQTAASEVLWDNRLWPESQDRMARLDWPKIEGFSSVRSFTLLRKQGAPRQCGSEENARAIERAFSILLEMLARNWRVEDEDIYQHLTGRGVTPALADRIITFGPMAFASIILRDVYPMEYMVRSENSNKLHHLLDEPVFAVGSRYAMEVAADSRRRDVFMALAARDAAFDAANQALNGGAKIEDMKFSPTMVATRGAHIREAGQQSRAFAAERELRQAFSAPAEPKDKKKKPWWKVW